MDAASHQKPKRARFENELSVPEKASKILDFISKQTESRNLDKKNILLRLFIEYAQLGYYKCSLEESLYLQEWISSQNINVYNKNWSKKYEDIVYSMNWNVLVKKPIIIAFILKDILPILYKCKDDVTYIDEDGKTVLHVFLEVCLGTKDFLSDDKTLKILPFTKRLIEMGASVNLADNKGITPFHIAVRKHHKELLELMLETFTNVHGCDENGNTILHYVVEKFVNDNRIPINEFNFVVCRLLMKGAVMHKKNKIGMTPVHVAAKHSHIGILKIFLTCGADVNLLTDSGETLLLVCCKNLHCHDHDSMIGAVIELLMKYNEVNATDKDGYSALHFLANYHSDFVKMIIKCGAKINCRTKDFGLTPLHLASSLEILMMLIRAGAEVNVETIDGVTPLLLAALNKDVKIVKFLRDQGANPQARDKLFGFAALHFSALNGQKDTLEFLLDKGYFVNDGGKYGITPLHLASLAGHSEIVQILINKGAEVNCQDKITRSTPLDFAAMKADVVTVNNTIRRIAAGNKNIPVRLSWKVSRLWNQKHDDVVKILIKSGVDKTMYGKLAIAKKCN